MDVLFHLVATGAMGPGHVDLRNLSVGGGVGVEHMLFSLEE